MPSIKTVGGVLYPRPGLTTVNESIIHLTPLSSARLILYPNPDDSILISVTNPLSSSNAAAVAPIPSPVTNTVGAVSYTHLTLPTSG